MKAYQLPNTEAGIRVFCGFIQYPHVLPNLWEGWRSIHGLYLLLRAFERGKIKAYVVADESERLISIGWFFDDKGTAEAHFASVRGVSATETARLAIEAMKRDNPKIKIVRANIPVENRPATLLCCALEMTFTGEVLLGSTTCKTFELNLR